MRSIKLQVSNSTNIPQTKFPSSRVFLMLLTLSVKVTDAWVFECFWQKPNFNEYYQIADIEKIRYSVKHKF